MAFRLQSSLSTGLKLCTKFILLSRHTNADSGFKNIMAKYFSPLGLPYIYIYDMTNNELFLKTTYILWTFPLQSTSVVCSTGSDFW